MPPRPIAALRRWLLVASLCALSEHAADLCAESRPSSRRDASCGRHRSFRRRRLTGPLYSAGCSRAAARYVPSYVVPLGIIGGGSPYQRVMMQAYFGSASVGHYCTLDTGWGCEPRPCMCPQPGHPQFASRHAGRPLTVRVRLLPCADITTPSDIICPVTQDPVYSPRNSSTAAAGQFATKNPWDASSPPDTRPGCNKTQMPLAGGPPTPTCAFNHTYSGTWESGGVVTDQLRFVAGLSGFNTWQAVDIRAVFGATT